MARARMIRPEIWESEQVSSLSDYDFRVYVGLISQADDEGRLNGNPIILAAKLFPLTADENTPDEIKCSIVRMENIKLIAVYGDDKHITIAHPNWKNYQTINRPSKSRFLGIPRNYPASRKKSTAYGYKLNHESITE